MEEIAVRTGSGKCLEHGEYQQVCLFGESWDRVVLENQDYIYKIACHLTGNVQEAEDITQETFLKAFEHRDGFRGESSVRTWLYRVAVNAYLARRRKSRRSEELESEFSDSHAWFESPEHLVIKGEFLQCIHSAEPECKS